MAMVDIQSLISSKIRISLLRIFSVSSRATYNINELSRLTAFTPRGVEKELKNLLAGGILKKTVVGNQHLYQLDPDCPISPEIRSLIVKTVGVADIIRAALKPHADKVERAFIYGSFASGGYNNKSDIDLFVVSKMTMLELTQVLGPVQDKIGRQVNVAHFGSDEFAQRQKSHDHFVSRVLDGQKIEILTSRT